MVMANVKILRRLSLANKIKWNNNFEQNFSLVLLHCYGPQVHKFKTFYTTGSGHFVNSQLSKQTLTTVTCLKCFMWRSWQLHVGLPSQYCMVLNPYTAKKNNSDQPLPLVLSQANCTTKKGKQIFPLKKFSRLRVKLVISG